MRRNMCLSAVVAVGLTSFLMGRPVVAHHAFAAEYDATKPVRINRTRTCHGGGDKVVSTMRASFVCRWEQVA